MGLSNGNTAEVLFKLRALEKGLIPSTPYGLQRYDFIIDNGKALIRVQVKMANKSDKTKAYRFNLQPNGKGYTDEQIDVFAFYIAPHDLWYIIPKSHVPLPVMRIRPICPLEHKTYEEAWYILSNWESTSSKFSGNTKNDIPPALPMREPL
jgi:hypothetical protein